MCLFLSGAVSCVHELSPVLISFSLDVALGKVLLCLNVLSGSPKRIKPSMLPVAAVFKPLPCLKTNSENYAPGMREPSAIYCMMEKHFRKLMKKRKFFHHLPVRSANGQACIFLITKAGFPPTGSHKGFGGI